jgi:TonB family protein
MEAVVSDILRDRMREPGGLKQTAVVSIALHAAAIAVIAVAPSVLPARNTVPPIVMSISLGGTPGPRTGGQMMLGGKAIQAAQPSTEPKIARTALPAPRQEPAMVLPVPDPRLKPRTPPKTTAASKDPKGTTGTGAEARPGNTPVETGAKGLGFGLSSGGGGGAGGYLDVQNFCCPEYLEDMVNRIYARWNQQQQATGVVLMKYTIQRSGQITDIEVERPSGYPFLDIESQRALTNTQRLAPLPPAFPEDHLTVHLTFQYERKR